MYSDKQIQQTNTEDDHCNHQAGQCDVVPVTSLITTVAKLQDLHDAIAIHHEQQLHRSHQNFIGAFQAVVQDHEGMPESGKNEATDDPHAPYLLDRVQYGNNSFYANHAQLESTQCEKHLEPANKDQESKKLLLCIQVELARVQSLSNHDIEDRDDRDIHIVASISKIRPRVLKLDAVAVGLEGFYVGISDSAFKHEGPRNAALPVRDLLPVEVLRLGVRPCREHNQFQKPVQQLE
eukprot:CAMPEP_0181450094 /NCGR_PEP_ID=MMETSP1110-20121109/28000_1 /TAXON_ID=174948 /ORGANISM="Symbiodinium sp., Strain CCMP421" /LENGTH=235 /DNA_ID=CAMNT_0023574307 /DNA_START=498 /DNA_END=1205 /DNA_ORIENTATION=-